MDGSPKTLDHLMQTLCKIPGTIATAKTHFKNKNPWKSDFILGIVFLRQES
jgi:hypothetical protein